MTDTGSSKASSSRNAALLSFIEKELYTAVVSDALDELGARDRALREHLRPLLPNRCLQDGRKPLRALTSMTSARILTQSKFRRWIACARTK